ncbi:prolyl aminopeptidase [Nitrosomonas sp. HPC101]|uniref:prolyl aminopeptidase n=1 Tax=Nitrosomonas sp. HPC101 TaxID=1658667 RepID=UPI00136DC72F|nr:prolyl aminopeptidase [Nitrosomonas sp. HPC101]MXS84711.1 prolyl aminopeptidase [Nitrosomonas sp. HPC101]
MIQTELFPLVEPYDHGMLPLDSIHTMYWEQSGNPDGVPVLFLHGGPGAGASPEHRRFFDPHYYRIIIFDQRGAGRSTPLGITKDNTTPLLIEDIETLRCHLGIRQWLIFGGSWGSTLALSYGEAHPESCLGFILRGIFLCRPREIDWFLYGLRTLFPEVWEEFTAPLSAEERQDILSAYYQLLMHPDPAVHMLAAKAWSRYEGSCSTLLPNPDIVNHFVSDTVALGLAKIEAHYFKNNIFLPENSLLDNLHKIRHLPGIIVQGRYDAVCPITSAYDLHKAWPEADYIVVNDAGHSAWEPGIQTELVKATEKFKS